jgi:hypothetical protein
MDHTSSMEEGFRARLLELLSSEKELQAMLDGLPTEAVAALGRRAAEDAMAPLIWEAAIGERWDIQHASKFLDISRQALYKRVRNGSALGIRGQGTTHFPVWQFDLRERIIRAIVGPLLAIFRTADPEVDPLVIAAWAMEPNRHLDEASPAAWMSDSRDDGAVLNAARLAARGLAQ